MLLREFTLESVVDQAILFHKELNPKLWKQRRLDREVRFKLLKIAKHFIEFIDIWSLSVSLTLWVIFFDPFKLIPCNLSCPKLYFWITNFLFVSSEPLTTVEYNSPRLSIIAFMFVFTFPSIIIPFGFANTSFTDSGLTE